MNSLELKGEVVEGGKEGGGGIRRLESIDSLEEERKERVTDIYTKEAIKAWPKESFAILSYLLFSYYIFMWQHVRCVSFYNDLTRQIIQLSCSPHTIQQKVSPSLTHWRNEHSIATS